MKSFTLSALVLALALTATAQVSFAQPSTIPTFRLTGPPVVSILVSNLKGELVPAKLGAGLTVTQGADGSVTITVVPPPITAPAPARVIGFEPTTGRTFDSVSGSTSLVLPADCNISTLKVTLDGMRSANNHDFVIVGRTLTFAKLIGDATNAATRVLLLDYDKL